MMVKKPFFYKKGWGNMISQSCDKIFKYQDVKELHNQGLGRVREGRVLLTTPYIYYNLFK